MKKHAYLIVAHNNWNILNKLFELIDDARNDVFLVIDNKSLAGGGFRMKKATIHILPRRNIYWADYSQVKTFLDLLRAAISVESSCVHYSYFHFLSGTDLPLKTQDYIHSFCDSHNKNFIAIVPKEFRYSTRRVQYYWPFLKTTAYRNNKIVKLIAHVSTYLQAAIGVNRLRNYPGTIYNGWQWASITHELAVYLLGKEDEIKTLFDFTLCPDELWFQTMCYNSEFRDTFYDVTDLRSGSMGYIDWERGKPYIWGQDSGDYDKLIDSPYLFARKFDERYMDIVNRIEAYLIKR